MFTESFPFKKINHHRHKSDLYESIWHNYSFVGKNKKRYIVIAEQFNYEVYAIKFYLQEHKSCEHKFSRITKQNECSRVITTVGKIMVELHNKNPYSSFVFVGSPMLKGENQKNTKRYRLYSRVVENLISPLAFEHRHSKNQSAYLLLNRSNNEENLIGKIEEMFKPMYQYL